jgi:hypothetical protein
LISLEEAPQAFATLGAAARTVVVF